MFKFFIENKLISSNQSGLKPDDPALINCYLSLTKYMNLLMSGLKLEASSFIYQKYLIMCGMMVSPSKIGI